MITASLSIQGLPMPVYPPEPDPLFSQRSLTTLLKDQIYKMENAVDELSDDVFLQNSPEDLIEAISQDAYLPPIELHIDKGFLTHLVKSKTLLSLSPVCPLMVLSTQSRCRIRVHPDCSTTNQKLTNWKSRRLGSILRTCMGLSLSIGPQLPK